MSKYLVDQDDDDKPEDLLALLAPTLTAAEHGALPVSIPDLSHLTPTELLALRRHIMSQTREARKKSNQLLNRDETLRRAWMDTVGNHTTAEARQTFQRLLVRFPAAFLAYTYANSLFVIDEALRAEIKLRSQIT